MAESSYTNKVLKLSIDTKEGVREVAKLKQDIKDLETTMKSLSGKTDAASREMYEGAAQQKKLLNDKVKDVTRQLQNEAKAMTSATGSITHMRKELAQLTQRYENLSEKQRNAKLGKGLQKQIKQTTDSLKKAEGEIGKFSRNVGNYSSAVKGFLKAGVLNAIMGVTTLAAGFVSVGNAIKSAITSGIEFNRQISKLKAITGESTDVISKLTAEAKRLGSTTRYTATEVASLQVELAKLGYKNNDIVNMTEPILYLAQATGTQLPEAAKLAGAAMRMFNKDTIHTKEYVDLMASSTANSALSFDYLQTALPIVGATAKTFGFELKDLLVLLGQLANSGLDASMAATATRNIFLNLANENGKLAQQLGRTPKTLKEMLDGLKELNEKGINLNDTLQLTDKRSVNAFNAFLRQTDAAHSLSNALDKAEGSAKNMAEEMENNLGGDITRLSSVWDDFILSLNSSQGPLRTAIQWLSKIVKGLADIVRSADEAIKIGQNESINKYTDTNKKTGWAGINSYKDRGDFASYKYGFISQGIDEDKAEEQAIDAVLKGLKEKQDEKFKEYEKIQEERLQKEKELGDLSKKTRVDIAAAKGSREIHGGSAATSFIKALKTLTDEEIKELEEYWDLVDKENDLLGQSEGYKTRQKLFRDSMFNDSENGGLGLEDDTTRNKRRTLEKRISKAELEAQKRLRQEQLANTKEDFAKRQELINNKYDQEIKTIEYKIDEEIRLLEEEAATVPTLDKVYHQKLARAKAYYQELAIIEKNELEKSRNRELGILDEQEKQRTIKQAQEVVSLRLDAVAKGTEAEYDLKAMSLANQQALELSALNELALKDEDIEKEKEERILAINNKYTKKKQQLDDDYLKTRQENALAVVQKDAIEDGRTSKVGGAKANLRVAETSYMQVTKGADESEEKYQLRLAQAYQQVLQARTELYNAEIEENTFAQQMNIAQSNSERERLFAELEYKREYFAQLKEMGKDATETQMEYDLKLANAEKETLEANRAYVAELVNIYSSTASTIAGSFGAISQAIEDCGEENETNVKRAKILGLAEIYIQQAVAIAQAIHKAWSTSSNWIEAIAATATSITTVVASTIQAISSIKKAKFAKGGIDIQGPGTSTSDSIPAQLSKGESVMTARATQMFKPLLAAMNSVAAQPNVTLPNMYSQYNPTQTMANNAGFGATMKEVMQDVHPVVAVKEINDVDTRMQRVQALDNF